MTTNDNETPAGPGDFLTRLLDALVEQAQAIEDLTTRVKRLEDAQARIGMASW